MEKNGVKFLHNVFFTLKEGTPANQQKLVDDCYRFLSQIPGVLSFAAGARRLESKRDVNDAEFHVALTILFDSAKSHDDYQISQKHKDFVAANTASWKRVRVFDSEIR
jgi:Stress responsive A/B Barrel Domain